jgi:hypothetical protein
MHPATSRDGEHQMPDRIGGGPHHDFNVVAKPIKAIHQFAFGQIGEVATHHAGDLRLGDPHAFCGFLLSQPLPANSLSDLDHQSSLDLELVGIGQAQVGQDAARTASYFDSINDSLYHVVVPWQASRPRSAWRGSRGLSFRGMFHAMP